MTDPATLELPVDPAAAAIARAFVRSWLPSRLEALLDSAVLLTSEVVTNAVLHSRGAIALTVELVDDGIHVVVTDTSPIGPRRRRHSQHATTGRGLQLLDDVAKEWGWEPTAEGKRIWFTLSALDDPWAAFTGINWVAEAGA